MHIGHYHRARQDSGGPSISGFSGAATIYDTNIASGTLAFNTAAPKPTGAVDAPPLASTPITFTQTLSSSAVPAPTQSAAIAATESHGRQIPLAAVIGICVGVFLGVVGLIFAIYMWFRKSTAKLSSSQRRNAQGRAQQQRGNTREFNRLSDTGRAPPPVASGSQEHHDQDEKNFPMFKKSPSVRTGYTTRTTTDEDQVMDLPQLDFTKYHPTLAQELALDIPEKPFIPGREKSGVSWDGETLGDDSFLSMRSVRVDSGTMSPTVVMAKMTPPATTSVIHRWESAEVLNADEESSPVVQQSNNPFTDMADERRSRNNPFFNAQEMNRNSRAVRSRSNSRTSRTSRAQSIVRPDSRVTGHTTSTNPFLDLHEAVPVSDIESLNPDAVSVNLPGKSSVPSGASAQAFGNDRAMASLLAALDISKEEAEERLRVVSMQASVLSEYSNDDSEIATVREFPLPPGTIAREP